MDAGGVGNDALTVSELAQLASVTVRALHHYDEIGLLSPSGRSGAGYRLYTDDDVDRLQQILFYRALEFPLKEIARIMGADDFDRLEALRTQRRLLHERARDAARLAEAIDAAIRAEETGMKLSRQERLEVFDGFDPEEHREEVEQRWGDTAAHRESTRRTSQYDKADWQRIKADMEAIGHAWVEVFTSGAPADSEAAMDVAERNRRHIGDNFYDCSHEMHVGLGEMYVTDPRFRKTYEDLAEGLATYVRDAIVANATRHAA